MEECCNLDTPDQVGVLLHGTFEVATSLVANVPCKAESLRQEARSWVRWV